MTDLTLKMYTGGTHGEVIVRDANGVITRRDRLTDAEVEEVHKNGGRPPGISVLEWEALPGKRGRSTMIGGVKDMLPGDIDKNRLGLTIFLGDTDYFRCVDSEYTGTPPKITVTGEIINRSKNKIVDSVIDGILTYHDGSRVR